MQHFTNMLSKVFLGPNMLDMELLVFELINQHSDDLRPIKFITCRSPDLITEVIEQLEMSRGENELDAVICRPRHVIRGDSAGGQCVC
jgi:hypothetical protein